MPLASTAVTAIMMIALYPTVIYSSHLVLDIENLDIYVGASFPWLLLQPKEESRQPQEHSSLPPQAAWRLETDIYSSSLVCVGLCLC